MFRYVFALLLLNSSYRSLGVPIPSSAPISMVNLLTALANSCENRFLSDQIKSELQHCSDLSSPHGEKQLECLIFFDINKQLCSAVGDSKLALNEGAPYLAKINEEQDVNLLCGTAKEWIFSNLTEFPRYKSTVEKIFKHPVTCGKICGVEDLMSDDANTICKYFKWGTDMLKAQLTVSEPTQNDAAQLPSETENDKNSANPASNDLQDVKIKNTTTNIPSSQTVFNNKEENKIEDIKPEVSSENNPGNKQPNTATSVKSDAKNVEEPAPEEDQIPSDQADKPIEITNPEDEKDKDVLEATPNKPDDAQKDKVDKDIQQLNNELEHKEPVIETPGQSKDKPADSVDYQDGDEGKEGLGDMQGDDDGDDDAMIGDVNKAKLEEQKEEPSETQNLKNVVSGITGESSLYPSFGQDEYGDADDDHFFSFFLTAVIMVVLIYILYHNKNKVGKVFFGLILEGRQSGRRRNSRGHSYRRLDTLEQAMSTNSAAPPSKIIY